MFSSVILEKGQVIAMVRYELKKVFGSVGGKIALILYICRLGAVLLVIIDWRIECGGKVGE